nr:immunoglobulin light chain junction region [Macaca mulatta]MPN94793.1 immunoglobulin light chain junction region [Macaca mulatta]MPN95714.1 immunoglobulin light chain junction region [Macaca mulatta]MPO02636.1 immunoglobulin light chain junction region [Macaca mulatta]
CQQHSNWPQLAF